VSSFINQVRQKPKKDRRAAAKKMKTNFEEIVYVVNGLKIEEMTYGSYLNDYWNDETTTPEGIANRTQVRAILLDSDGYLVDYSRDESNLSPDFYSEPEKIDEDGNVTKSAYIPEIKYGLFTWSGAHGSGPLKWNGDSYDTEEEAYNEILKGFEHDYQTKSLNVPQCYFTIEEAKDAIAEGFGKPYEVIERYFRFKDFCEQKKLEQTKIAKQKEAERCEKLTAIYAEMIDKIEGESYKETCTRLSVAIGSRIESKVFHASVKKIRTK
jgi:hypothetical protein